MRSPTIDFSLLRISVNENKKKSAEILRSETLEQDKAKVVTQRHRVHGGKIYYKHPAPVLAGCFVFPTSRIRADYDNHNSTLCNFTKKKQVNIFFVKNHNGFVAAIEQ